LGFDVVEEAIAPPRFSTWFNSRRIYEHCGDIPAVELEALYYQQNKIRQPAEISN
jgi:hypothetical protein